MATELERLYVRVFGDTADLEKKLNRAQRLVADFGDRMSRVGRALQLGLTLPLGVAAAAAVKAAAEMDGLRRSLATVVGGTAEANRELDRLKEIAKLPGLGFREAVRGAVQLNVALEGMNDRVELANRLLTQFGNAIALTGGGAAELDRVILQLGQMAAAGRVLTADLRPIIQTAPAVATALRRAFGTIDAQAIERMGLSTEEFFNRLLKGLESLPRASRSARTSFEDLSDAVFRLRAAIGEALLPALEPLIARLTDLSERVTEAEGSKLRWAVAIGAALAVVGPLTVAVGALVKVVAALAAGISTGLLVAIGAVLVGLSGLVTWFVKSRLEAAALAKQMEETRRAFSEMLATASVEDLKNMLDQEERRKRELVARRKDLMRQLEAVELRGLKKTANYLRKEIEKLDREYGALLLRQQAIRDQIEEFRKASGGPPPAADGRTIGQIQFTLDNLRRLDEAFVKTRERLAELRFELAFETQEERAEKLREEIERTEARMRALGDAIQRAGLLMRFLRMPEELDREFRKHMERMERLRSIFQRRTTPAGRPDPWGMFSSSEYVATRGGLFLKTPFVPLERVAEEGPEPERLSATTRALIAFEIGLKDLDTSFREAASVMGSLELAAFSLGRVWGKLAHAFKAAARQVTSAFIEIFNPLRIGSQALGRTFQEAEKAWEPLDKALAPVAQAIGEALKPAVEALAPVFQELGPVVKGLAQILAALLKAVAPILRAIAPILRALFPIIKLAAIGLTYLGQVVAVVGVVLSTVAAGIAKAIGSVIEAIGKLIDKLPFVSAKGIINFGRNLKAAGDAYAEAAAGFRDAFKELGKARDEIRDIELDDALDPVREAAKETSEALRNVPSGFKIALARFQATTGAPPPGTAGAAFSQTAAAAEAGSQVINDNRTINVTVVSDDPERIWREIQRRAERDGYRMHGTLVPAVR